MVARSSLLRAFAAVVCVLTTRCASGTRSSGDTVVLQVGGSGAGDAYCTGLLLGSGVALTAAHCLDEDRMWVAFPPALEPARRKFWAVPSRIDRSRDLLWLKLSPNAPRPKLAPVELPPPRQHAYGPGSEVYSLVAGIQGEGGPEWHMHIGHVHSETADSVVVKMEETMCRGDSGGALLRREGATPVLLGILHGGMKHDDLDVFAKVQSTDVR